MSLNLIKRPTVRARMKMRIIDDYCWSCGIPLSKAKRIWHKRAGRSGTSAYYCDDCKRKLFEGIKYHEGAKNQ